MPTVRSHVHINAPAAIVWRALCDTPVEAYHPLVVSSRRSADGSIHEVVFRSVDGSDGRFTVFGRVVERDEEIRRLRVDTFSAQGPAHDLPRPAAGGDTVYDVLDADSGCVLVMSITDLPSNTADRAIVEGYTGGLKRYCER